MLRVSRHLLRFEERGLLLGWGFIWCISGVSARIWFGSGIPPTLSVVGVRSALSLPLRFSTPVGIRVQPVLQRISGEPEDWSREDRVEQTPTTESVGGIPLSSQTRSRDTRNAPNEAPP